MEETHKIMGGKVNLYRRGKSQIWQCSTYLEGKNHRTSTKQKMLTQAKEVAETWYLDLKHRQIRGEAVSGRSFAQAAAETWFLDLKHRQIRGEAVSGRSFAQAADRFMREYPCPTPHQ